MFFLRPPLAGCESTRPIPACQAAVVCEGAAHPDSHGTIGPRSTQTRRATRAACATCERTIPSSAPFINGPSRSCNVPRGAAVCRATSPASPNRTARLKTISAMNVVTIASLRAAACGAALLLIPAIASARGTAPADSAAHLFATTGIVPVVAAKPYRALSPAASSVQIGTWQTNVSLRLGRPSAVLDDGTWLYRNFTVDGSVARGTLVVQFAHGDVSQLSLVSPAVEAAMLTTPAGAKGRTQVASK